MVLVLLLHCLLWPALAMLLLGWRPTAMLLARLDWQYRPLLLRLQ